jgi:hypothetical protein
MHLISEGINERYHNPTEVNLQRMHTYYCMDVVNTQAYYDTATITAVKSLKQAWARSFNDDT